MCGSSSTDGWPTVGRDDDDVWRDNAVRVTHGDVTLRYRWRHVAGAPCATAAQVAAALRARGWQGSPARCAPRMPGGCAEFVALRTTNPARGEAGRQAIRCADRAVTLTRCR